MKRPFLSKMTVEIHNFFNTFTANQVDFFCKPSSFIGETVLYL
jgi:hypothetical protein